MVPFSSETSRVSTPAYDGRCILQLAWGGVSALIRPDFVYEDA